MRSVISCFAVFVLACGVALAGETIYVDDVTDPAEDGSIEHPFDAIQEAIDAAAYEVFECSWNS